MNNPSFVPLSEELPRKETFNHILPAGQFYSSADLEVDEYFDYEDHLVSGFLLEQGVEKPTGFSVVRPAMANYWFCLHKSDCAEVWNQTEARQLLCENMMEKHFSSLTDRFVPISFENIRLKTDTSPGFPWKGKKRDVIIQYFDYLRDFCRGLKGIRGDIIFKITAKVEYQLMMKILEHKIRLFRNPPIEYLLLEKMYFQMMEDELTSGEHTTWSALGLVKESGGWDRFVSSLTGFSKSSKRRWYFGWDVRFFDKRQGPRFGKMCFDLRRKFFKKDAKINEKDLEWLYSQAVWSHERTYDGSVWATGCGAKSGRFLTSTDNTFVHIYILFELYLEWCDKYNHLPSHEHCMTIWMNWVYSDDIQGVTVDPTIVDEELVRTVFQRFGMDIHEYFCSEDPLSIQFLGAKNRSFDFYGHQYWVPVYDEERMFYALVNSAGGMSDELRAARILGLMHNLCFSKYADLVFALQLHLDHLGRWPSGIPKCTVGQARYSYAGLQGFQFFPCKQVFIRDRSLWDIKTCVMNAGSKIVSKGPKNQMLLQERKKRKRRARKNKGLRGAGGRERTDTMGHVFRVPRVETAFKNSYLQSLLDPELYAGCRLPSMFGTMSGMTQLIINNFIPYFQSTDFIERPGTYLAVISPEVAQPVLYYQETTKLSTANVVMAITSQNAAQGLSPLLENGNDYSTSSGSLWLDDNDVQNLRGNWVWSDLPGTFIPGFLGFDPQGNTFYGYPMRGSLLTLSAAVQGYSTTLLPAGVSTVLFLQMVTVNGVVEVAATVNANGHDFVAVFTNANVQSVATADASGWHQGLPGFGFRVRTANLVVGLTLASITVSMVTSDTTHVPKFLPYVWPDQQTLDNNLDQFRTVSYSAWLQYQGATLTDGGQHAAIMYRGGQSPMQNGLWSYQKITQTPTSYQGALKLGSYSFWVPQNVRDTEWRHLSGIDRWSQPYFVLSGVVASTDIPNTLRLRVVQNIEFISTSQIFSYDYSDPNMVMMQAALSSLRGVPTSMENPLHLKEIAKKIAQWVHDNAGTIATGAKMASALLL